MAYNCTICKKIFIEPGEESALENFKKNQPIQMDESVPVEKPAMLCDPCALKVKRWYANVYGFNLKTFGPTNPVEEPRSSNQTELSP